jgi:hypothetical protein
MFKITETPKNLTLFATQTIIIIIISLFGSVILDIKFTKFRKNNNLKNKIILDIIQLLLGILYIYILMFLLPNISNTFQTTLPGMYFPGIFFAIQYNLFVDIQENITLLFL